MELKGHAIGSRHPRRARALVLHLGADHRRDLGQRARHGVGEEHIIGLEATVGQRGLDLATGELHQPERPSLVPRKPPGRSSVEHPDRKARRRVDPVASAALRWLSVGIS